MLSAIRSGLLSECVPHYTLKLICENSEPDYSFSLAGKALLISKRNITGESIDSVGQDFVSKGGSKKTGVIPKYHYPCFCKSG